MNAFRPTLMQSYRHRILKTRTETEAWVAEMLESDAEIDAECGGGEYSLAGGEYRIEANADETRFVVARYEDGEFVMLI